MATFFGNMRSGGGIPSTASLSAVREFVQIPIIDTDQDTRITGVTRDSSGNPLANCLYALLRTGDNSVAALGTSDANGNFVIYASSQFTHYIVAYKAGSPDVAGTTVNTLVGT